MTEREKIYEQFVEAESRMAELEAEWIDTHGITGRSGYVPQNFDEIGDEKLRELAQEDLEKIFPEDVRRYKALKVELGETA
jgi:hypothetical protein